MIVSVLAQRLQKEIDDVNDAISVYVGEAGDLRIICRDRSVRGYAPGRWLEYKTTP